MPSIIIRRYQYGDQKTIRDLVSCCEMEKIVPLFKSLFLTEITLQVLMIMSALVFIFGGIPLKFCLLIFPGSAILFYLGIYLGLLWHLGGSLEDLDNCEEVYMQSPNSGVWVAEIVAQSPDKNVECLQVRKVAENRLGIIGVLALKEKVDVNMQEPPHTVGLISRFTIEKQSRRLGAGSELLSVCWEQALKQFRAVEVLVSENQSTARNFLEKHEFTLLLDHEVSWLPSVVSFKQLRYRRACVRTIGEDDLVETHCQK